MGVVQLLKRTRINARHRMGRCQWCGAGNQERWGEVAIDRTDGMKYVLLCCEPCVRNRPWDRISPKYLKFMHGRG